MGCATTGARPPQAIAQFVNGARTQPSVTDIGEQVLDANRGYAFFRVRTESGRQRNLLQLFMKRGFFHVFSVYTYIEDWPTAYPLIRTIVEYWADQDGMPFDILLPAMLG